MFLFDGDNALCRTSVLHCEDERIGMSIFGCGCCGLATLSPVVGVGDQLDKIHDGCVSSKG
jgi:hypothetical protein